MPISEDTGNQPAAVHTSGASPATTASFTPQAGTLLIAMIAFNAPVNVANTATITDSLSGTWTLLKRQNTANASLGGSAEVWCRYMATPAAMTVTGTWTGADLGANLVVRNLLGADPTQQPGVTAGNGGASIAPTAAIVPRVTGSRVYGAILRFPSATAMTANASTTIIDQFADATNGDTYVTLKGAADTTSFASVTYGCTDANSAYNVAFAEILPLLVGQPQSRTRHPGHAPGPKLSRTAPPKSITDGDVYAYAGVAEGFGSSYGVNDHSAGLLLALAGAQTGTAAVSAQPAEGAGTGTAYDATVSTSSSGVNAPAEAALGTGTAYDASVAITTTDTGPGGTGTAGDAQAAITSQPPEAAGTGTGFGTGVDIAGLSGTATGTGAAGDPSASLSAPATEALGTGTGYDAQGGTGALPGAGSGTGAAFDTSVASAAQPSEAAGTGTAYGPAPDIAVNATNAPGVGQAYDATPAVSVQPSQADGTGTSLGLPVDIQVFADWGAGTGTAYDATVSASGNTNAPAEAASGTGTAYNAGADVQAFAGTASGTGTAFSTSVAVTVTAAEAIGSGLAYDASVTLPQAGTATVISGREPNAALYGREPQKAATGTEAGLINGRESLSSTSGTEPPSTIHGREP